MTISGDAYFPEAPAIMIAVTAQKLCGQNLIKTCTVHQVPFLRLSVVIRIGSLLLCHLLCDMVCDRCN